MAFDYLNSVEESIVARGLEGKVIMVYGNNDTGKSLNATKFPKPVILPFEVSALNAVGGVPKLPISDWATFRDFTDSIYRDKITYEKNLLNLKKAQSKEKPKDKEEAKELEEKIERLQNKVDESRYIKFKNNYKTIVIDTLTAMGKSVEKYILDEAEVQAMGDVAHGKLYKAWENEAYHTFNKFFNLGDFTYLILAHEDFREYGKTEQDRKNEKNKKDEDEVVETYQAYPKGDKRVVKPVIDLCDVVVYLKSNGSDENHKVIPSSAILVQCETCFARSRWDNMDLFIKEYSAKNLEAVINKAINEQEENGVKVGTYGEQQKSQIEKMTVDWKEIKDKICVIGKKIYEHDGEDLDGINMIKFNQIVEEFLGKDEVVPNATEKQLGSLQNILSRTEDLMEELV